MPSTRAYADDPLTERRSLIVVYQIETRSGVSWPYIYSFFVDQSTDAFVPDLAFLVDSRRFELPRELTGYW